MSFSQEFDRRIEALEQYEYAALGQLEDKIEKRRVYPALLGNDQKTGIKYKDLARLYLQMDHQGQLSLFDGNAIGQWANSSDEIPIPQQLLLDRRLVVDLKPCKNEVEFIRRYKVTPEQMFRLVDHGLVSINFLGYKSGKSNSFKAYKEFENDYILQLLDPEVTRGRVRILGLRRTAFYDLIIRMTNPGRSFHDFEVEGREIFSSLLRPFSQVELNRLKQVRTKSVDNLLETMVQQYAYCQSIIPLWQLEEDPRAKGANEILTQVETRIEKSNARGVEELEDRLGKLRGLKSCLASPITSSMGGVYAMSSGAYGTLYTAYDPESVSQKKVDARHMDLEAKEFLREVQSMTGYLEPNQKQRPMDDGSFISFMAFLDEKAMHISELNRILNDLEANPNEELSKKLLKGKSFLEIQESIEKEISRLDALSSFLNVVGIVTSGISGPLLGLAGLNIIGVALGLTLDGVGTFFKPEVFLSEDKMRINALYKRVSGLYR